MPPQSHVGHANLSTEVSYVRLSRESVDRCSHDLFFSAHRCNKEAEPGRHEDWAFQSSFRMECCGLGRSALMGETLEHARPRLARCAEEPSLNGQIRHELNRYPR
jgi:hypothetical protein